jgi:hypothetical protein
MNLKLIQTFCILNVTKYPIYVIYLISNCLLDMASSVGNFNDEDGYKFDSAEDFFTQADIRLHETKDTTGEEEITGYRTLRVPKNIHCPGRIFCGKGLYIYGNSRFDGPLVLDESEEITQDTIFNLIKEKGKIQLGTGQLIESISIDGDFTADSHGILVSQKAIKSYVDSHGVTTSTDGTLSGNADDVVPTEKAVKTYVDSKLSTDITLSGDDDTTVMPTERAVKTYVDNLLIGSPPVLEKYSGTGYVAGVKFTNVNIFVRWIPTTQYTLGFASGNKLPNIVNFNFKMTRTAPTSADIASGTGSVSNSSNTFYELQFYSSTGSDSATSGLIKRYLDTDIDEDGTYTVEIWNSNNSDMDVNKLYYTGLHLVSISPPSAPTLTATSFDSITGVTGTSVIVPSIIKNAIKMTWTRPQYADEISQTAISSNLKIAKYLITATYQSTPSAYSSYASTGSTYEYTYDPTDEETSGTDTDIPIPNVPAGHIYKFKVQAYNDKKMTVGVGEGTASSESSDVTAYLPLKPTAPRDLALQFWYNSSNEIGIRLSWKAPLYRNSDSIYTADTAKKQYPQIQYYKISTDAGLQTLTNLTDFTDDSSLLDKTYSYMHSDSTIKTWTSGTKTVELNTKNYLNTDYGVIDSSTVLMRLPSPPDVPTESGFSSISMTGMTVTWIKPAKHDRDLSAASAYGDVTRPELNNYSITHTYNAKNFAHLYIPTSGDELTKTYVGTLALSQALTNMWPGRTYSVAVTAKNTVTATYGNPLTVTEATLNPDPLTTTLASRTLALSGGTKLTIADSADPRLFDELTLTVPYDQMYQSDDAPPYVGPTLTVTELRTFTNPGINITDTAAQGPILYPYNFLVKYYKQIYTGTASTENESSLQGFMGDGSALPQLPIQLAGGATADMSITYSNHEDEQADSETKEEPLDELKGFYSKIDVLVTPVADTAKSERCKIEIAHFENQVATTTKSTPYFAFDNTLSSPTFTTKNITAANYGTPAYVSGIKVLKATDTLTTDIITNGLVGYFVRNDKKLIDIGYRIDSGTRSNVKEAIYLSTSSCSFNSGTVTFTLQNGTNASIDFSDFTYVIPSGATGCGGLDLGLYAYNIHEASSVTSCQMSSKSIYADFTSLPIKSDFTDETGTNGLHVIMDNSVFPADGIGSTYDHSQLLTSGNYSADLQLHNGTFKYPPIKDYSTYSGLTASYKNGTETLLGLATPGGTTVNSSLFTLTTSTGYRFSTFRFKSSSSSGKFAYSTGIGNANPPIKISLENVGNEPTTLSSDVNFGTPSHASSILKYAVVLVKYKYNTTSYTPWYMASYQMTDSVLPTSGTDFVPCLSATPSVVSSFDTLYCCLPTALVQSDIPSGVTMIVRVGLRRDNGTNITFTGVNVERRSVEASGSFIAL